MDFCNDSLVIWLGCGICMVVVCGVFVVVVLCACVVCVLVIFKAVCE